MAEMKEGIDAIKESLHHLGRKFGICLFLAPMDEQDTMALPSASTMNEGGFSDKET